MNDLFGDFTPDYAALSTAYEPNDTAETAVALGEGRHQITGSGTDWFALETGPGELSLSMVHATEQEGRLVDLSLTLLSATGQGLAANYSTAGSESFTYFANQGGSYYLRVTGMPAGMQIDYTLNVELPTDAWSVELDFGPIRNVSPAVFDIDNDGIDEIFVGTSKALDAQGNELRPGGLVVLEADGTVKWSKTFDAATGADSVTGKTYNSTSVTSAPTFSDLNGDGSIDLVVGVGADNAGGFGTVGQPGDKGGVYAVDAVGNTLWYFETRDYIGNDGRPDGVLGAPRVFDIDSDGVREVIFTAWDHYMYVLDGRTGALEYELNLHDTAGATPGVADLTGDGFYELIVPADISANPRAGLDVQGGLLHVISRYGQHNIEGFDEQVGTSTDASYRGKFEEQSLWSSPKLVDLENDGSLEIVQGTGDYFKDGRGQYLKVWNSDGTLRLELETTGRTFAAPIIADIDGNGTPEIVAATTSGYVHAWNAAGQELFATRVLPFSNNDALIRPIMNSPVAVDIDNSGGDLEILVTVGGQLVVLDSDGTQLTGIDRPEYVLSTGAGSPVAKDIDGDGTLALIGGGTTSDHNQAMIYRWENPFDAVTSEYRSADYQGNQSLNEIRAFVDRFYEIILGRSSDARGTNNWADRLYSGVASGADVAEGFILSPEFLGRNTSNAEFVGVLYAAFFDRTADSTGLGNWVARLESGEWDRAGVLDGFIYSQEFSNLAAGYGIRASDLVDRPSDASVIVGDSEASILRGGSGANTIYDTASAVTETGSREQDVFAQVYRIYGATLGREPDVSGLLGWFNALNNDVHSLEAVAGSFVNSKEFQNTYGALSNGEFVALLYNNVLGREPDARGLANWTSQLDSGAMTRAQVVLGFSESGEFKAGTTAELDDYMRGKEPRWNDVIEGGAGNDRMNGGNGSDVFVFRAGEGGSDVIYGFEPWDGLQLSGFGFTTPANAVSHMVQTGANVVFQYGGQTITFLDMRLSEMGRVRYNLS
ncbi:DUF4214 domain-containing protein [Salipiger sp. PrR002]|uniref:DUF4214 domain-containing protein n=1 Tax=Salipiger sp. PrR002 TaxID=2706489 RepID=UPI0013B9D755|nr:DUF4214 domain-containing protein [Salipiger sp. PrR002]NDW01336.1 DUF4214 domain-containing protein [Salipiger sp. PrR002]NDW58875.1 DUF4214 domain-containing protein [Salipiger sp. PrR004]